jgi:hypothetical protein
MYVRIILSGMLWLSLVRVADAQAPVNIQNFMRERATVTIEKEGRVLDSFELVPGVPFQFDSTHGQVDIQVVPLTPKDTGVRYEIDLREFAGRDLFLRGEFENDSECTTCCCCCKEMAKRGQRVAIILEGTTLSGRFISIRKILMPYSGDAAATRRKLPAVPVHFVRVTAERPAKPSSYRRRPMIELMGPAELEALRKSGMQYLY